MKEIHRGPTPCPGERRVPPYRARPLSPGPPSGPPASIFCYIITLSLEKNRGQAYGTKLRRHKVEPWRNQSRALAELFCRGHFPPGGENHHQRDHQRSSHREGINLHQHLHQHHLLSNPSSSLCLKTSDWYQWVASSVDYSL